MKKSIIFLFIIALIKTSYGQVPVDSIYTIIKRYNIHSKLSDWGPIELAFGKKLALAKNDMDSMKAFIYVFEQLKDNHSGIFYKGSYLSNYPTFNDEDLKYLGPLVSRSNMATGQFIAKLLDQKSLYIQIPEIQAMGDDVSVYAQMLSDTLSKYVNKKTKGIVIDLRLNGGGQFSSMAAGIAPLLGDGYIGGGINSEANQVLSIEIKKGNIYMNDIARTNIKHKTKLNLNKLPIAIIIGPATRSSGSILAIAFKGRPNTIFIGENTADGYSTSNDYFTFGNDLAMSLSTSHSMDRNNKVYKNVVEPDIIIKGIDDFNNIENDIKVQQALKWLKR
jgi:carboxyl-terminal processing protease